MQYIERKIAVGWPQPAIEFIQLFARIEGALKQSGYLKKDKKRAEADWTGFADRLGPEFFQHIRDSEQANTLVCTENLILIDYVTESPNVNGDDRAALLLPDPVRLAVQVEEPT